jgi:hypothetical protein
MRIDGEPYTVVGFTKGGFVDEEAGQLTVPLALTPEQINHDYHWLQVRDRLKLGVTLQRAQADMDVLQHGQFRSYQNSMLYH